MMMSEEEKAERLLAYNIELALASGASLEILMFSHTEHRWLFQYKYSSAGQMSETLINDIVLRIDYDEGISKLCRLTMDMVCPERRGKQYFFGLDISEGSHIFLEFLYKRQKHSYDLITIRSGNSAINLDSSTVEKGLTKIINTSFPFPFERTLRSEFGIYKVPFLKVDGTLSYFEFPDDCRRTH